MDSGALQGVPQGPVRAVFEFDIPDELKDDVVKKTVGLRKINGAEEVEATKSCGGDGMRLAFELVKQSLHEIDGKVLNKGDMEHESKWERMDPKLRNLLLAGYASLHSPEDDEVANFLKSRRAKVG